MWYRKAKLLILGDGGFHDSLPTRVAHLLRRLRCTITGHVWEEVEGSVLAGRVHICCQRCGKETTTYLN